MNSTSNALTLLAEAFRYPAPGHLAALEKGLQSLPVGSETEAINAFLGQIRRLSLGAWEELYTHTLDLNPPAAPYIGFQTWGESYQRGVFLSNLSRELLKMDIDTEGELPDHLIPILRYLALASDPLPELVEHLDPALRRMSAALRQAEANNPYLNLLDAAQELCKRRLASSRTKKEPV